MTRRPIAWILAFGLLLAVVSSALLVASVGASRAQDPNKREISVTAKKYTYVVDGSGSEIRVKQNDLVTISLTAQDIAHSFTISDDHYRIDRRAEPGKTVQVTFRADKVGEFVIRCTLTTDDRCARDMRGKLVVVAAK
jgi:heme/copper-type cytochrome/quinol oxidase subunit 2